MGDDNAKVTCAEMLTVTVEMSEKPVGAVACCVLESILQNRTQIFTNLARSRIRVDTAAAEKSRQIMR